MDAQHEIDLFASALEDIHQAMKSRAAHLNTRGLEEEQAIQRVMGLPIPEGMKAWSRSSASEQMWRDARFTEWRRVRDDFEAEIRYLEGRVEVHKLQAMLAIALVPSEVG